MDTFGNRASLLKAYPEIVELAHKKNKDKKEGQTSLFGDSEDIETKSNVIKTSVEDFSENEKLAFEKEFLGLYLTSHPQLDNLLHIKSRITYEIEALAEENEGIKVKVGGIIETIRKTFTKRNNNEMAFMAIGNERGLSIECVVFPKVYDQYKSLLVNDTVVIIEGSLDTKNDRPTIIAERIFRVNSQSS